MIVISQQNFCGKNVEKNEHSKLTQLQFKAHEMSAFKENYSRLHSFRSNQADSFIYFWQKYWFV